MVFLVFIAAFSTANYVAYGYLTSTGYTWTWSFFARIDDTFGGPEYAGVRSYNRILGIALQTGLFITVLLILLNLFIAILDSAYEEASEAIGDAHWARHQFDLVNHFETLGDAYAKMWNKLKACCLCRKADEGPKKTATHSARPSRDFNSAGGASSPGKPSGAGGSTTHDMYPKYTGSATELLAHGVGKSTRDLFVKGDSGYKTRGSVPKKDETMDEKTLAVEMDRFAVKNEGSPTANI
jgi:hypothetical protein